MLSNPHHTMSDFEQELDGRLVAIRKQGLHRELRPLGSPQLPNIQIDGRSLLNFSSNDYLGLANHPALKEAAIRAVEKYGAGSGASRLICGSLPPHQELEQALCEFEKTEAALAFSSGYATALGAICALLEKDDVIVIDKLVHACIVDAARLSGAKLRIFGHNKLNDLAGILQWADRRHSASKTKRPRTLIVTESLFSMDGDVAPLKKIVALKEQFGAWLMVDEAHATGLYGAQRRGLAEEAGVTDRIEIQMGTLGKALGASGGYICGSRRLIDLLINRARSFIFSTAPVPAACAAASAAIRLVQSTEGAERCYLLWRVVEKARSAMKEKPARNRGPSSAIIPLLIGDEQEALMAAALLRERGIFIPAIRYPTVARGQARLRVTVTAAHTAEDIAVLARTLEPIVKRKS